MNRIRAGQKKRVLSEAEQMRSVRFEKTAANMRRQGYTRRNLTVDMATANRFAVLLFIPLAIIGYGMYFAVNHTLGFSRYRFFVFALLLVVCTVLHELIHGVTWSIFTPHGFRDIEFGFMRTAFAPYCTCTVPLKREHHLLGTVMPLIILGIIPMIVGTIIDDPNILLLGVAMSDSAAGDILIIQRILSYKSNAREAVYMDHPTDAGCVVFER